MASVGQPGRCAAARCRPRRSSPHCRCTEPCGGATKAKAGRAASASSSVPGSGGWRQRRRRRPGRGVACQGIRARNRARLRPTRSLERIGNGRLERGARCRRHPGRRAAIWPAAAWRTAVFRPEKEKSGRAVAHQRSRQGEAARIAALAPPARRSGRRDRAGRAASRSCRKPRPARRRSSSPSARSRRRRAPARTGCGRRRRAAADRESQPVGQPRRQRVAFEMVDGEQRLAGRRGDRLGRHQADHQAADQAGTGGGGDGVDVGQAARPPRASAAAMMPSSASTWARAAISGTTPPKAACSSIWLSTSWRGSRARPPSSGDHGCRRLVAAGLDAEDTDHLVRRAPSLPDRRFPDRRLRQTSRGRVTRTAGHANTPFRIGTRGSPLALAQARRDARRLVAAHRLPDEAFEIVPITTSGDRIQRPRRWRRPAARGCSPRRSRRRCSPAASTSPSIRPRTCRPCCRTG